MGKRLPAAALAVPLLLGLVACGADGAPWQDRADGRPSPAKSVPPLTVAITPAANAQNMPISTEIGTQVSGGNITDISVTEDGAKVSGSLRPDGTSWVPERPLKYRKSYAVSVTATGEDGKTDTKTTSFTTMRQPGNRVATGLYMSDGGRTRHGDPAVAPPR